MATIRIEIQGNTGQSVQEFNNVATAVENIGEQEKKVAKTEEEKWKEARDRSERKKKWLEEQKKLEAEADEANGKRASGLSKLWSGLDDYVKKAQGGWTNLNSKIQSVTGVIGTGVGFLTGTLDKIKEVAQEYEKLNNQMTILSSQKGSGEIILQMERLEEVTNGVVGKFDLLESVNKATSFGIDLTGGRLEKLVGVASKAAATMGTDLKDAFESLVVGTARQSMMILDNLGVMVDVTKANEEYAASIGKSKDQLTDVEQKTALLNQVLERLGRTQNNIVDEELLTAASGTFNRISRAWQSVKLTVGEYASEFLQWVDDWGRSEEQLENQKYKNMLGDVRDYYERKMALSKQDLDEETKKYLETHQMMTAEQKADYIRMQDKKRIQIEDLNQEQRITDVKASNLNDRLINELHSAGVLEKLWFEQEKQRQMLVEQGVENNLYMENYRMLNSRGIHKMYTENIKSHLNEAQVMFVEYYERTGSIIDSDFLLFKNRILDSVEFALKALKGFENKKKEFGTWYQGSIITMFGLEKDYFTPTTKKIWDNIKKDAEDSKKAADKAKAAREVIIRINKETEEIINKTKVDAITDPVKREEEKYNQLKVELEKYSKDTTDSKKLHNAKILKLQAELSEQELVVNKARIAQEEEYFGEDGLLNKIQKEGATKDKEDNKIINEEKLAILMENNAIKYDLILAQREFENTVQMDSIKSEEKAFQRRLEIAKSYTKDATDLIFTSLTDKRVALDNEIADNKEAYKKGYITEEEYIKKKDELNKKSSKFRENLLKEVTANAMKRAGSEIFNDGLTGLWQGGRWALSPWPSMQAQGVATIGYSLAEMGAGLALGYAGSKLMPRTGVTGTSKDEASKDKNDTMKNNKQDYKVNTYLFPDERQWLQQLQASQTRLNG